MKKNTFWLLEDDDMTQMVVSSYVLKFMAVQFTLKVVASAKEIVAAPGDIILSDQQGVDLEYLRPGDAEVISMSGNRTLEVDIYKPFKSKDLEVVLSNKLNGLKAAA